MDAEGRNEATELRPAPPPPGGSASGAVCPLGQTGTRRTQVNAPGKVRIEGSSFITGVRQERAEQIWT